VSVSQRADLGVVAVHDEHGLLRESGDRLAPAFGDELELAISVELVAEEIPEADRPRPYAPQDLRQRGFIHLEQAELGVAGREEGGGDPGEEVRARVVVREWEARTQDLGRHRRGRRLAVRRGQNGDSRGKPGRQAVDRARVELREEFAWHGHSGARADPTRQACNEACNPYLDRGQHRSSVRDIRNTSIEGFHRGPDPFGGRPALETNLRSTGLTCICGFVRTRTDHGKKERKRVDAALKSDK
jgi:hypothetical protein